MFKTIYGIKCIFVCTKNKISFTDKSVGKIVKELIKNIYNNTN